MGHMGGMPILDELANTLQIKPDSLRAHLGIGEDDASLQALGRLQKLLVDVSSPLLGRIVRQGILGLDAAAGAEAYGYDESMRLASLVYRNSKEGMLVTDARGVIIDVNPAFEALRGFSAAEAVGQHVRTLNSSRHSAEFYRAVWGRVLRSGSWQGEHWGQHSDGSVFPEWLSINTIYDDAGEAHRRVIIFSNISQIKQAEAIIWRQANFDLLTGLPNRQLFMDRLERSITRAHRNQKKLAILFLDLDRFKEINDTLGHAMGDNLLKEVGKRLQGCVRSTDTVARLGGDEFTVILDDLHHFGDVGRVTEEILRKMAEPFALDSDTVFISTSIGVTYYPDDGELIDDLLNYADQAMYVAKNQGRNRYARFDPCMQEAAQTRMRLLNDMHLALPAGEFSLVYQPIVDLCSARIVKTEVLLRWQHPTRGLILPGDFIPLAEESGMILEIGEWVFRQAARQIQRWREHYDPALQVSINASPMQFRADGIDLQDWLDCLAAAGTTSDGITLEITEGVLLDQGEDVLARLEAFRAAGMRIALDDFGVGYSSLSYLRKFDIDYLKIDRSFVSSLTETSSDLAVCEAIIVMAHKLGLRVIAEGIETAQQRALLTEIGCDLGQGYLFARPLAAEAFEDLLRTAR